MDQEKIAMGITVRGGGGAGEEGRSQLTTATREGKEGAAGGHQVVGRSVAK